ncbi:type II toxin-antitoxin system HicB family antitoxin [[Limnothrix rosea] IAM M-220]|uniref:type II toxin-antitoxin system HicB family antitoxin n=1 Tax=[Limnothrix rosea] IAM M-220 TaxID=454133 RepID=UPI000966C117|nr:type II toxin-antitoxin system HicB family antitoxin [[Limnothrix rosea] IAM M-220]OKH12338.1 DNA repair protein [[Limnothrix rosea] IAM M-220]
MYTATYKGYTGKFEIDFEENLLSGIVIDIRDVITFHGKTIEEAVQCFHESVDDYLEFCEEVGEDPDKPFSGRLPYRTSPETHRQIYLAATKAGKSINAWMDEVLAEKSSQELHRAER